MGRPCWLLFPEEAGGGGLYLTYLGDFDLKVTLAHSAVQPLDTHQVTHEFSKFQAIYFHMLKILTDQFVVNVLNPRLECGQLSNCFAPFCPHSPLFFPPTQSISVPRWVRWTAPNLEWHKQANQLFELRLSENTKTALKYTENI